MVRKSLRSGKKSLYLFLLVFVVYALIYMTKNCYSAAMASIVDQGIMTKSQTGLIAAMFYLIYAPFQIVGGIAADRYSPSKMILVGMLGAGICNLLVFFFSQSYIAMMIIWSLNAIIQFGIWPSIFKIITTELKEEQRSFAVQYIGLSSTFGLILSYACAAVIRNWEFNFLISAIILFFCVVGFFVFYRRLERDMVEEETIARLPKGEEKKEGGSVWWTVIKCGVPLMMIAYAIQGLLSIGLKSLVPVMLMESYEAVSPSLANVLNIFLILIGVIGLFLVKLPIFKKMTHPVVISVLFLATIPMLFLMTFIGRIHILFVIFALVVIMLIVTTMGVFYSYVSKDFAKLGCSGTLSGLFNCMSALGMVLANYVFTKIAEKFDWPFTTQCFLIVAVIGLALMMISIPMWKKMHKNEKN